MKEFSRIDNVDILGPNPYRESLMYDKVVQTIDSLSAVKPIYFPEAWVSGDAQRLIPEDKEIKFLKFIFNFSQEHKFTL